jgi:hypothetical protein
VGLTNPITDQQFLQWTAEMVWNNPSLAQQVPPIAYMNKHGGDLSKSKEAWQAAPAKHDSSGSRPNSSHRASAAKEAWQQGQRGHGSSKRAAPSRAVQGWEGSAAILAAGYPTAQGAPQQGVQPLPFIGYANERPAATRGQKTKKSKPTETAVPSFPDSSAARSDMI